MNARASRAAQAPSGASPADFLPSLLLAQEGAARQMLCAPQGAVNRFPHGAAGGLDPKDPPPFQREGEP
jgi:hypothetical protein